MDTSTLVFFNKNTVMKFLKETSYSPSQIITKEDLTKLGIKHISILYKDNDLRRKTRSYEETKEEAEFVIPEIESPIRKRVYAPPNPKTSTFKTIRVKPLKIFEIKLQEKLCNNFESDTLFEYLQGSINEEGNDYVLLTDYTRKKITGILIASNKECNENKWSIKLVCSSYKVKGGGQFLIALYLYALKEINQDFGFLELAYGYANIKAFCLYSKFGFVENAALNNCPVYNIEDNLNNVKMTVDMKDLTQALIIQIFLGTAKYTPPEVCGERSDKIKQLEKQKMLQEGYTKKLLDHKIVAPEWSDYMRQILETGIYKENKVKNKKQKTSDGKKSWRKKKKSCKIIKGRQNSCKKKYKKYNNW